jgi:hypothetical protein
MRCEILVIDMLARFATSFHREHFQMQVGTVSLERYKVMGRTAWGDAKQSRKRLPYTRTIIAALSIRNDEIWSNGIGAKRRHSGFCRRHL